MNIKFFIWLFSVVCLIEVFAPSSVAAQSPDDILIVANKDVSNDTISKDELVSIFLKQRTAWKDGLRAVPLHAGKSELRSKFLRLLLGLSALEEKTYWQEQKITKGISPPPEFNNQLKAVFKLKGAISYIYRSEYKENVVKILMVVPQL